jgi:hypothetical protein
VAKRYKTARLKTPAQPMYLEVAAADELLCYRIPKSQTIQQLADILTVLFKAGYHEEASFLAKEDGDDYLALLAFEELEQKERAHDNIRRLPVQGQMAEQATADRTEWQPLDGVFGEEASTLSAMQLSTDPGMVEQLEQHLAAVMDATDNPDDLVFRLPDEHLQSR